MKVLAALLALAVVGLLWMRHENKNLTRSFERANQVAQAQKNKIGTLESQLSESRSLADKNESAQVTLRQRLEAAGMREVLREQAITRLLNENEALRNWYRADLPDAVRSLHRRPACASAGSCLQRLPESESLPEPGERPAH